MNSPVATRWVECEALLQQNAWVSPAFVGLDQAGDIVAIRSEAPGPGPFEQLGYVIPGFQNAHSHAFQYLLTGLAEYRAKAGQGDDFWAWREEMYRWALKISPGQMEAVAAMVYAEMLRHGYTAVAEFHYLHRDPAGCDYQDPAEMSRRLIAAANTAGIHLTLVPVLYQKSGFERPAAAEQRRFTQPVNTYKQILATLRSLAASNRDLLIGQGVHSLRAVATSDILDLFADRSAGPLHLHAAEQTAEVEQCLRATGQRPVAWLLDHVGLDHHVNLVHATHLDAGEARRLASSGATVIITPSTEANLGDGLFQLKAYWAAGGRVAIGSDSQVGLSPLEELRWLDYGQRLQSQKRQILLIEDGDSHGRALFSSAWSRGRMAMGLDATAFFAPGQPFDAVVIDPQHPTLYGKPAAHRLSALIYAGTPDCLLGTIRRGRWVVQGGRHHALEPIRRAYHKAVDQLMQGLKS